MQLKTASIALYNSTIHVSIGNRVQILFKFNLIHLGILTWILSSLTNGFEGNVTSALKVEINFVSSVFPSFL